MHGLRTRGSRCARHYFLSFSFNPGVRGFQQPFIRGALLKQLQATAAEPLEDALVSLKALDDFLLVIW